MGDRRHRPTVVGAAGRRGARRAHRAARPARRAARRRAGRDRLRRAPTRACWRSCASTSRAGQRRVLAIATDARRAGRRRRRGGCWTRAPRTSSRGTAARRACRCALERWLEVDELVDSPLVPGHLVGSSAVWRSALREIVEVGALQRRRRADLGRERHRQGAGGAAHPHARPAAGEGGSGRRRLHDDRARRCRAASCSGTSAGRSPGRWRRARAPSRWPTAGRCSSTRSGSCRRRCRPSCCASSRRGPTSGSAATAGSGPGSGSCARPTAISRRTARPARFRSTCSSAWRRRGSGCRRCASGAEDILAPRASTSSAARRRRARRLLSSRCCELLLARDYPGNVRDLKQLMARIAAAPRRARAR